MKALAAAVLLSHAVVHAQVVQEDAGADRGTAAIFHLNNPGPIGSGTIEVSAANPNGGLGAAYALSGTLPGFGARRAATPAPPRSPSPSRPSAKTRW